MYGSDVPGGTLMEDTFAFAFIPTFTLIASIPQFTKKTVEP